MFPVALCTIVKIWNQTKYPLMNGAGKENNGVTFSHKKNEILKFAATWMEVKNILSKINQYRKSTTGFYLHVETKELMQ